MKTRWVDFRHEVHNSVGEPVGVLSTAITDEKGNNIAIVRPEEDTRANRVVMYEKADEIRQEIERISKGEAHQGNTMYFERINENRFLQRDPHSFGDGKGAGGGPESEKERVITREELNTTLQEWRSQDKKQELALKEPEFEEPWRVR